MYSGNLHCVNLMLSTYMVALDALPLTAEWDHFIMLHSPTISDIFVGAEFLENYSFDKTITFWEI